MPEQRYEPSGSDVPNAREYEPPASAYSPRAKCRRTKADRQRPVLAVVFTDAMLQIQRIIQQATRHIVEYTAISIQTHAVFLTVEQNNAQIFFQLFHIAAKGWLRKMQHIRGFRQGAVFHKSGKLFQNKELYHAMTSFLEYAVSA